MKMVKRAGRIVFVILLILALSTSALAIDGNISNQIENEEEFSSTTVRGMVADEITLQRQKDGSFVGSINVGNTKGVVSTTITVTLTGNVASITNRYLLQFHWTGTAKVGTIAADTVKVTSTSILFADEYFSTKDYSTSCYGATSGVRSAGTFNIPKDVTKVRVKTTGLKAYFLDGAAWYATPSINTTFEVN